MDIEVSGHLYRSRPLNAKQQLHVARRLASTPLQFLISQQTDEGIPAAIEATAQTAGMTSDDIRRYLPNLLPALSLRALGEMTEADAEYVINVCMSVLQRRSGANGTEAWTNVLNPQNQLMQFQDIGLKQMLELTVAVLRENLGDFFGGSPSASPEPSARVQTLTG